MIYGFLNLYKYNLDMDVRDFVEELNINNVKDLSGKKVILRIDVNVTLGGNGVVDNGEDWRIIQSLGTIEFLRDAGASVIILAHIGRNKKETLKPIFEYMNNLITLGFLPNYDKNTVKDYISNMGKGSIVMMENVRRFEEEIKNDISYLEDIISLCDIYVNDAFSVSHREHASVNGITKVIPSYFGLQFVDEVNHITEFLLHKSSMKTLLLGGAKFGTKLRLLENILPRIDYALIGGALANVFLKDRGFNIGKSFYDNVDISHIIDNEKIILPIDYIDEHGDVASIDDVEDENIILDIGPETVSLFEQIMAHSSSIMWNGPMGKYEGGYVEGSIHLAKTLSHLDLYSLIGGGDTSTLILENGLEESFSFISTGGGAMLDFLVDGTLPGIDIIIKNIKKED